MFTASSLPREQLRRELQDRGYLVVPDRPLPDSAPELAVAVRADLEKSKLSVHTIGAKYGRVPEGELRSVVAIQNAIAQERAIPRILWIPVGVEAVDPRQEAFLASVRQHSGSEDAVEVVETSLED